MVAGYAKRHGRTGNNLPTLFCGVTAGNICDSITKTKLDKVHLRLLSLHVKHFLAWERVCLCVRLCCCACVCALRSSYDVYYTSALAIGGQTGRPLKPRVVAEDRFPLKLWRLDHADKYPEAQNVLTNVNYCGHCVKLCGVVSSGSVVGHFTRTPAARTLGVAREFPFWERGEGHVGHVSGATPVHTTSQSSLFCAVIPPSFGPSFFTLTG